MRDRELFVSRFSLGEEVIFQDMKTELDLDKCG